MPFAADSTRRFLPALYRRGLAAVCGLWFAAASASAVTLYWDTNGNSAGAGATPTGNWSTSGGTNKNWSTSSTGGSTVNWTSGSDAVFSAGSDATNAYTVTLAANQNVASITIEEGSPTFNSNAINFNGTSANFTVASGSTATVNSNITGALGFNKLGAGTVIFGTSDKTYTGTTTVTAGTLQLDFNQTFSTVNLAGGELLLNSATTSITTLNVTANSIIDFSTAATLNVTTLNLSAGVTLTIQNWTQASDFFYATNWTGATPDLPDNGNTAPMNQISFTGFGTNLTGWDSYDKQIRPNVPEPTTYGACMLAAMTTFFAWRRWRGRHSVTRAAPDS